MDWRLRGIPPALWRRVRDKAGDRLHDVLLGLLRAYVDDQIDPLSGQTPAGAFAASGGRARAEALTPVERSTSARAAARARWASEKRAEKTGEPGDRTDRKA